MTGSHQTVAVSTSLRGDTWAAVRAKAKRERRSITSIVRPLMLAALETDRLPPFEPIKGNGGSAVGVRVPREARARLGELAERHGLNVSQAMAAIIEAEIKG